MKAFISVDMEGMPFVVSKEHLMTKGSLYEEVRKIATEITMEAAKTLHEAECEEVIVADSHGEMVAIIPEEIPEYVSLVRGFPRPLAMISGAKGCDFAVFLGYHARAGTSQATFDHTYSSSTIDYVKVNGKEASEFLLNSYALGELGIPVILVGGDKALLEEVKKEAPWIETVEFKKAFSRTSGISPSMRRIKEELREKLKKAVNKFKLGEARPLKIDGEVKFEIRFLSTEMADLASLLPFVERIGGKEIKYFAKNFGEGYKVLEFLAIGTRKIRGSMYEERANWVKNCQEGYQVRY